MIPVAVSPGSPARPALCGNDGDEGVRAINVFRDANAGFVYVVRKS